MSRLEDMSVGFRKEEIARNDYNQNKPYNQGNPDALSTGDEAGKGEFNGSIGSATDIKVRKNLTAKNKFTPNKEYNLGTA
jgi:hypothetical protein